jgi:ERCC4-type nuclease
LLKPNFFFYRSLALRVILIPALVIDSSEAGTETGERVKEYFERHGHTIVVKPAQADYVWSDKDGNTVCVERSTPSDFWGKVTSGRWIEQLDSELVSCDTLYYVISGYRDYGYLLKSSSRDIDSSFTGALTAVARVARLVPVWHEHKFPHWLLLTFEKEVGLREPSKISRMPRKRGRGAREVAIDMLTALPYVGASRAEDMADDVCSIRELLSKLSTQPLQFLARFLSLKQAKELEGLISQDYCSFKDEAKGSNNNEGGGG